MDANDARFNDLTTVDDTLRELAALRLEIGGLRLRLEVSRAERAAAFNDCTQAVRMAAAVLKLTGRCIKKLSASLPAEKYERLLHSFADAKQAFALVQQSMDGRQPPLEP